MSPLRKESAMICMISPGTLHDESPNSEKDRFLSHLTEAASAGIDLIQIREKRLGVQKLSQLVSDCVEAVRGSVSKIIVNERFDVALACGAHGAHLPSASIPGDAVRAVTPTNFIIGKSTHSLEEIDSARSFADYVFFSPIFETPSKIGILEPKGIDALSVAVVRADGLSVIALGGINPDNVASLGRCGVAGVAGIGMFSVGPVTEVVSDLRRRMEGQR